MGFVNNTDNNNIEAVEFSLYSMNRLHEKIETYIKQFIEGFCLHRYENIFNVFESTTNE